MEHASCQREEEDKEDGEDNEVDEADASVTDQMEDTDTQLAYR